MNENGMDRRDFLKTAGAVGSGALLASCTPKEDSRFVSVVQYEDANHPPGAPWFFQSTCTECPANCGIEVKTYEKYDGKVKKKYPVKLEGLKGHPVNGADGKGNLCMRGQGALNRLYAPEKDSNLMTFSLPKEKALLNFSPRVQSPRAKKDGKWVSISWEDAFARIRTALKAEGRKNAWLAGRTTGTLSGTVDAFCKAMNVDRLPDYEVYSHAAVRKANEILFGIADVPQAKIGEADFLLTLGVDILETHISPISFTKQLTERRKSGEFTWFHLEPHISLTGIRAGKGRLVIQPGSEPYLLAWLLDRHPNRKALPKSVSAPETEVVSRKTGLPVESLEKLAAGFVGASRPLLIVGGVSTAHATGLETALLAGLLQWVSGMTKNVLDFTRTENYSNVGSLNDIDSLSKELAADKIGVLFVGWTDPVGTVPASLGLGENFKKAGLRVSLTDFLSDTAKECDLVLPLAHSLESDGDTETRKGTWSRIRSIIDLLGETRTAGDILLGLQGKKESYRDHLAHEWKTRFTGRNAAAWEASGVVELDVADVKVKLLGSKYAGHLKAVGKLPVLSGQSVVVVPSLRSFDGRSAPLRLMEEIPDPLSTISYGKWCAVSESVAKELGLEDRDWVDLQLNDGPVKVAVKVQPGLPDGIVMIQRDKLPDGISFGISAKTGEMSAYAEPVTVEKLAGKVRGNHMVVLSGSMSQEGRGIIRTKTEKAKHVHKDNGFYPTIGSPGKILGHPHDEIDWAMSVDLDVCTGCSACVAACYTENNIPMVGSWDHWKGREMSWLRIEPYKGPDGIPQFIPMMCQHCHNAPCEPVCPVYATMHTPDGLNAQVYNRCVGTRYCSNNCPYKVRRFNWWGHEEDKWEGNLKWMQNPEVSIRTKGIMEKCTFCIQRIRKGRDTAKDEKRPVRDGDVTPACAQTCPTGAITFGNLMDKDSKVHRLSKEKRSYQVFEELGTVPSVYYLR
jgi:molybdopterin-containing oxidoreductase family iron-sulfur binding subunit